MKLALTAAVSLLLGLGLGWLAFHAEPVVQTVERPGAPKLVQLAAAPSVRVVEVPTAAGDAPTTRPEIPERPTAPQPSTEELTLLRARVAQLEATLETELKLRRANEGAAVEPPAGLDPRFRDEQRLVSTFNAALKEAGFPGQVSSVDCSEHPCIVFGTGFGDRGDMEKLSKASAFEAYAKDSLSTFGFLRGKDDPASRFFGVAVMPNAGGPLSEELLKRVSFRARQMEEVSRPPPQVPSP